MKIRRYIARSTVSELESGRRSLMTPGEAARGAAAGMFALSDAATNVSRDMSRLAERQRQLSIQEARQQQKLTNMQQKIGLAEIAEDPAYQDQVQPDGSMTASVMLERYENVIQQGRDEISQIEDDDLREQAMAEFELESQYNRVQLNKIVNARREVWNARGEYDLLQAMIDGKDYEAAYGQLESIRSDGLVTEAGYRQLKGGIDSDKMDFQSDQMLQGWEAANAKGNGDEYYNRIVADQDMDSDLKRHATSKIENQMANYERARSKAMSVAEAGFMRRMTNIQIAQQNGQPEPETIESLVADMQATGDPQMMINAERYYAKYMLSTGRKAIDDSKYQNYKLDRQANQFVPDDKANREFLERETIEGMTPDMTPEQIFEHEVATMLDANMLSQKYHEMFDAGVGNAERLSQVAPIWSDLVLADPNNQLRTSLDHEVETRLTSTAMKIESGIDPLEAAQEVIELDNLWRKDDNEMKARQDQYNAAQRGNDSSLIAKYNFDELIGGTYDANPYLPIGQATVDGPEETLTRYRQYFYDAFMRTRDFEVAKAQADMRFQQTHAMTKINGDWEVQFNGLDGDVEWIREQFFEANKDEVFSIMDETGGYVDTTIGSVDDLYYTNARPGPDGHEFDVYSNGRPIIKVVEDEETGQIKQMKVVDEVSPQQSIEMAMSEFQKRQEETIAGLREDLAAAQQMVDSGNPYAWGDARDKVRDIPNKIKALEREVEKEQERIRNRYEVPEF